MKLTLKIITFPDIFTERYTLDRAPSAYVFHHFYLHSHPLIKDHQWRDTFFHFLSAVPFPYRFTKDMRIVQSCHRHLSLSFPSQPITLNLLLSFHHNSCQSGPKILYRVSYKWQEDRHYQHSHSTRAVSQP